MGKNRAELARSTSVAPASIESLERDLKKNLQAVSEQLSNYQDRSNWARQRIAGWKRAISVAEHELSVQGKVMSDNAHEATKHMMDDARKRVAFIQRTEIDEPEQERQKLVDAQEALSALLDKLELQRFREDFNSRSEFNPQQRSMTTVSDDYLASIDRELRRWTHNIQALKELQS